MNSADRSPAPATMNWRLGPGQVHLSRLQFRQDNPSNGMKYTRSAESPVSSCTWAGSNSKTGTDNNSSRLLSEEARGVPSNPILIANNIAHLHCERNAHCMRHRTASGSGRRINCAFQHLQAFFRGWHASCISRPVNCFSIRAGEAGKRSTKPGSVGGGLTLLCAGSTLLMCV